MLTRNSSTRRGKAGTARFAVVASEFNRRYVDGMLRRALLELRRAGARSVTVVRVPGAFEVPVVAARLVQPQPDRPDAVICLGVIFRGETTHAQHVGDAVSLALAQLQVQALVPVIHGVYLFENEMQAKVRCLGSTHNRGTELARTALAMARVMSRL